MNSDKTPLSNQRADSQSSAVLVTRLHLGTWVWISMSHGDIVGEVSYMQARVCTTCGFLKSLNLSQSYPGSQQQGLEVGFALSGLDGKQESAGEVGPKYPGDTRA